MIHRLLTAEIGDPLAYDGRAVHPLRQLLVPSNAHAMLKAITPLGHGVAVSLFCGPFVPSGREPELSQDAIRGRNVRHGDTISSNGNRTPLADVPPFPVRRVHGS